MRSFAGAFTELAFDLSLELRGTGRSDIARELEACEGKLMRVRLAMAELKRIGSQQGLSGLTSEATMLSMRIQGLKALSFGHPKDT